METLSLAYAHHHELTLFLGLQLAAKPVWTRPYGATVGDGPSLGVGPSATHQ